MKKYDLGIAGFMIVFAGWIFYATRQYPSDYSGAPGSGFWPRVLAVVAVIFAVVLIVLSLSKRQTTEAERPVFQFFSMGMKRIYWMLFVMLLTAVSILSLGFILTSLWFASAVMVIMNERRVKWIVLASVGITATIYIIFSWILNLSLPAPFFL